MENEISPGVKVQVRVRDDAPTKLPCHCETRSQTGRGNPRPLTPHQDHTPPQVETDCHVGLCPPRNDGGGRKPVAPISAAQNVENGAPTKLTCHSETSSQTGRGNPFLLVAAVCFMRGVRGCGLPCRFAPRNDRLFIPCSIIHRLPLWKRESRVKTTTAIPLK